MSRQKRISAPMSSHGFTAGNIGPEYPRQYPHTYFCSTWSSHPLNTRPLSVSAVSGWNRKLRQ